MCIMLVHHPLPSVKRRKPVAVIRVTRMDGGNRARNLKPTQFDIMTKQIAMIL